MSNNLKFYLQAMLYNLANVMITGSVIQSYLLESGVSEANVSLYFSATQVVQVVVMLLASGFVDKIKKPIFSYSLLTFLQLFMHVALLFACSIRLTGDVLFVLVFASSMLGFAFYGIHAILSYKIPYYIIDMNDYGKITGKSGVLLGVIGALFSFVLSWCVGKFEYFSVMTVFFALGSGMLVLSGLAVVSFKPLETSEKYEKSPIEKINLLRYKPFLVLFFPNLLRGFNTGIFLLATVIGYNMEIIALEEAAVITVLTQLGMVLGCSVYSKISKPSWEGKIILLASVLLFFSMPAMVIGKSAFVFCLMYFLSKFFMNFVDYSVPTAITQIVDYKCMGQYSAWRMLLHTAGVALGGVALTYMMNIFGGFMTLVISSLCQLVSGVVYCLYSRKVGQNNE